MGLSSGEALIFLFRCELRIMHCLVKRRGKINVTEIPLMLGQWKLNHRCEEHAIRALVFPISA